VNEFWDALWPDLTATIAGVIVGLPVALWVNRIALRATIRREESSSDARLRSGLESVVAALSHNKNELQALAGRFGQGRLPLEASLDISAWDESRDLIASALKIPDLQRRLAWHFSRLKSVHHLNALYIELMIGTEKAAAVPIAGKDDLRSHLTRQIRDLLSDIESLRTDLQAAIAPDAPRK
jgi:hypothetical protein